MREPRLRAAPPVTVPQGSPLPSGWNRAPASGSHHNLHHTVTAIFTVSSHWAHTRPQAYAWDFPSCSLSSYSHIILPLGQCHLLQEMPPPTPIGSDFWGNSQQINIPLCTALVVPYCCIDTLTSLAPAASDHGLPEVREGVRAITQNPSSRRKQPHATTG